MTRSERLIVVVGMTREARIVGDGPMVIIGGSRPRALGVTGDVAGVLSFGLCGALDPGLAAGDLVVGEGDRGWCDRLMAALPDARRGAVAGSDAPVATAADKAILRRCAGAIAVDMESHLAAEIAAWHGAPLAILRAVSDTAGESLPSAALAGFRDDGEVDVGAVLWTLVTRPGELPALIRTARGATKAFRSLRDARDRLGPGLGCPYLGEPEPPGTSPR